MVEQVFVVLGILGFIGVLAIAYRLQSQKHITEINMYQLAMKHQLSEQDRVLGELAGNIFLMIEKRRDTVEEELLETQNENVENGERILLEAEERAAERIAGVEEGIQVQIQTAQRQMAELETHFRDSVKGDPAKHLMAMAYAVAATPLKPRDKNDVALRNAVFAHRKAFPVVKKPEGDLN